MTFNLNRGIWPDLCVFFFFVVLGGGEGGRESRKKIENGDLFCQKIKVENGDLFYQKIKVENGDLFYQKIKVENGDLFYQKIGQNFREYKIIPCCHFFSWTQKETTLIKYLV